MSAPAPQPSSRATRLVAVGIVLTILLGVVAFVSRGHVSPTGSGGHDRRASQALADIFFTFFVLAMVSGVFVLLYVKSIRRSRSRERFQLRPLIMSLSFFAGVLVVVVLVTGRLGPNSTSGPQQSAKSGTKLSKADRAKLKLRENPDSPSFNWPLAAGIAALILGASVTAVIRSKRRRSKTFQELRLAYELAEFLDQTLDDIRGEADPRRAVIAAYARMELILSAHGLPRRPSEAPLEYLSRVLLEIRVSELAVRKLTALYERAKFSEHEIDATMKEEAIDALESLRDDLRAVDAPEDARELRPEEVPGGAS
jgi:membrane protease YdiL (CAAX protease family)